MSKTRAYDAWQPVSFNDFTNKPAVSGALNVASESAEPDVIVVEKSPEDILAELKEQTKADGYKNGLEQGQADGHQQGYDAGYQAGLQAAQMQADEAKKDALEAFQGQLDETISHFMQAISEIDKQILPKLVQIALTAAKQVVGETAMISDAQLVTKVKTLLNRQPVFSGNIELCVNPADLPLIDAQLSDILARHHWTLVEDPSLDIGGYKIISPEGELDATISTAWETLNALAIGENDADE